MAEELCPTCHSKIGTSSTQESERAQGKQGADDNENPVPRWTDDPIFTTKGLSGSTYSARTNNIKRAHIREIQKTREAQEIEVGIPTSLRTDFSTIAITTTRVIQRHIIVVDSTLEEYFKLDDDGEEQPQNPNLANVAGPTLLEAQSEWIDVARGRRYIAKDGNFKREFTLPDGSVEDSPTLPSRHPIRAIHIEDLRHPVPIGVLSAILIGQTLINKGTLFKAKPDLAKATFKRTKPCGVETE